MSRFYNMGLEITGYDPARKEAIIDAAHEEWSFEACWDGGDENAICSYGEDYLCGGESEEEFTERLSLAIWKANGAYCEVTVDATCLENLPFETHCLDEDDYQRLMNKIAEGAADGNG